MGVPAFAGKADRRVQIVVFVSQHPSHHEFPNKAVLSLHVREQGQGSGVSEELTEAGLWFLVSGLPGPTLCPWQAAQPKWVTF